MDSEDLVIHHRNHREDLRWGDPESSRRNRWMQSEHSRLMAGRRVAVREEKAISILWLAFPRFDVSELKIWLNKCIDYFTLYHVPEVVWVTSASLHLEGNATRWFQVYKPKNGLGPWREFEKAIPQKFGADEYSQTMRILLDLHQKGTVEDYLKEFEEVRYSNSVHNHELDETLFVTQFIKGLKNELQGSVQAHLPTTVDRAALLAQMQQSVIEK